MTGYRKPGRKEKYGEPTKVIRVPVRLAQAIEKFIRETLKNERGLK